MSGEQMAGCYRCGRGTEGDAGVCGECAMTDMNELYRGRGEAVVSTVDCPLCDGSGRCFFCSPGGPCYHCSGSGREHPGSEEECHICGGLGDAGKGCEMCEYTRRCKHCGGTGRVPAQVKR